MNDAIERSGAGLPFAGPSEEEKALLGLGEPPAFLRRGMSVTDAEARVHLQCEAARDEMLFAVKLRLRAWNRLTRDHRAVGESMSEAAVEALSAISRSVFAADEPTVSIAPSGWTLFAGRHWRALVSAVEEFNANWRRFLKAFQLDDLHRVIDGYNRFYVLEKECAVRSIHTARRGFVPKERTTVDDLLEKFPPLPRVPRSYRTDK